MARGNRLYEIESKPTIDVGFDVTDSFSRILVEHVDAAFEGRRR